MGSTGGGRRCVTARRGCRPAGYAGRSARTALAVTLGREPGPSGDNGRGAGADHTRGGPARWTVGCCVPEAPPNSPRPSSPHSSLCPSPPHPHPPRRRTWRVRADSGRCGRACARGRPGRAGGSRGPGPHRPGRAGTGPAFRTRWTAAPAVTRTSRRPGRRRPLRPAGSRSSSGRGRPVSRANRWLREGSSPTSAVSRVAVTSGPGPTARCPASPAARRRPPGSGRASGMRAAIRGGVSSASASSAKTWARPACSPARKASDALITAPAPLVVVGAGVVCAGRRALSYPTGPGTGCRVRQGGSFLT